MHDCVVDDPLRGGTCSCCQTFQELSYSWGHQVDDRREACVQGPWGDESEAGQDNSIPAARSRAGSTSQATLDPVFTDNSRLSEAAALVEKMLPLAREVSGSSCPFSFTLFWALKWRCHP